MSKICFVNLESVIAAKFYYNIFYSESWEKIISPLIKVNLIYTLEGKKIIVSCNENLEEVDRILYSMIFDYVLDYVFNKKEE